ncbi:hypothetical protein [Aquimarina sp. I32.4]|uniref:hypothetical protein n=1 Tax=Aquimarina sp. I32.4 TaxID=2053903 RepID=UPI000CDEE2FB|nr:hypothetical protein [Aquimarina sp. I32.4]
MIQNAFRFRTEERQLYMPKEGIFTYSQESIYPINYSKKITCSSTRKLCIEMLFDEDQPYVRLVTINIENHELNFSDGSYAMKDILKRVTSIYDKIQLRISYKGVIVGIDNLEELQDKWKEQKEYIQQHYKGEQVQRYIHKTEYLIHSETDSIDYLLEYQHLGGVLKSLCHQYSTDHSILLTQPLITKYGKVMVDEEVLLQPIKDTEKIQLTLSASYPQEKEYLTIDAMYDFCEKENSWIEKAEITVLEKYGREEYQSSFRIKQI